MEKKTGPSKVFVYQSVGFLAIITLSWLVELLGLRALILGDHPYISDFRESALEMLFILTVWLLVGLSTRRILNHVRHLEAFMRVCAWCHHINFKERWMPLEEFFQQGFDTPTTHGICPGCLHKQKAAAERARAGKSESPAPENSPTRAKNAESNV